MSVGVGDRLLMKMLLRQNAEIKQQLMLNTWLLQELVKKHKVSEGLTAGKLLDNVQLPLKSQDDVHKLERQLISQDICRQLVSNKQPVTLWSHQSCSRSLDVDHGHSILAYGQPLGKCAILFLHYVSENLSHSCNTMKHSPGLTRQSPLG